MTQRKIEIEKKFLVTPGFRVTLLQEGAILVQENEFSDSYYDFADYKLSLQNCWIRTRNKIWEMKYFGKLLQKPGLVDSYRELDNEKDILEALADYISPNVKDMKSMTDMTDFVKAFGLKVFASFKTTRTKYRLDGVSVDLDVASFGYSVGEIEIVVESEEEIPDAEAKLENLAKKLGINWKASYPGKLEEYLRLHNLSLYREFVAKGVLRNHSAL